MNIFKRFFTPSFYNNQPVMVTHQSLAYELNVYDNKSTNTAINICSRIIANTVASLPINIYQDVDGFKEIVKNDYRHKALHFDPNGYTNHFDFWYVMEIIKQSKGNSFALMHRFTFPNNTKSISLEFVHPSNLIGKPEFVKGFLKYKFKTLEGVKTFDANDVIHFKKDSEDTIMGISPYVILNEEVKRAYLANKTVNNHYENDGKGQRYIETVRAIGDNTKWEKRFNDFRKETGGSYYNEKGELVPGNSDKMVSFPGLPGNTKIQDIPSDINDALYLATIQNCDLKIAAHFGIPPNYLNILQAQKSSDIENLQLDFKSSTIQHICTSNRKELEMKFLTTKERNNGMSIEFNSKANLELSLDARMKSYESLKTTAGMSMNEVRKLETMARIEGGDEHYMFEQMTTLGDINKDVSTN